MHVPGEDALRGPIAWAIYTKVLPPIARVILGISGGLGGAAPTKKEFMVIGRVRPQLILNLSPIVLRKFFGTNRAGEPT